MVRRAFALVVLGVVVLVCTALAASEYLANRTGKTATAVTVTFSEEVRITSHDESVFSKQEPTGRAETFTFSGGELANGGRFKLSWTPGSAEISNVEWETSASAAASLTSSGGPLTYGQIMAEVAHYPGPEEPLYVPADGEQIWLTDLEGHADIYDNDSITINYAPGFDRSAIARIDVYRNGVKLQYLPPLLDGLTNDEMKTFDGNPVEKTPESSHTDHAIWGYEYEIRFLDAEGRTTHRLLATISCPITFEGRRSVNIGVADDFLEQLSDQEMVSRLSRLKDMGFEAAQFSVFYFIESPDSNRVIPVYKTGTPMTASWARTMADGEVVRLLRLIREAGLEAGVRLELWLNAQYKTQNNYGGDRGQIAPRDANEWFKNYSAVCIHLAGLAESEHASVFYAGVELDTMGRYAEQWRGIAADIHGVFSGSVSLVEATHHFLAMENCGVGQFESLVGQFWDAFDFIAVDFWPDDCLPLETQSDQHFSVAAERFVSEWRQAFDYYRAMYPGKRIEFGEIGSYNFDGALVTGYRDDIYTSTRYAEDIQEMSDAWAALLVGVCAIGADGIEVFTESLTNERSTHVANHWLNATPAQGIVEASLGAGAPVATQSLPVSALLGFDWEQLPPLLSFSTAPNVEYVFAPEYASAFGSGGEAQYWGQSGCKVEAVRAALYDDAVVVQVTLHKGDSPGHYRYIVAFRSSTGSFYVFLDPGTSSANLALDAKGVWTDIGYVMGEDFATSGSTMSAVIRNELFSAYVSPSVLLRSSVDLHIDYVTAGRRELFIFPGEASSPTDRSGQEFLVP